MLFIFSRSNISDEASDTGPAVDEECHPRSSQQEGFELQEAPQGSQHQDAAGVDRRTSQVALAIKLDDPARPVQWQMAGLLWEWPSDRALVEVAQLGHCRRGLTRARNQVLASSGVVLAAHTFQWYYIHK